MREFCGLNDRVEKENTRRNPWTYKRGPLGANNQGNGRFKRQNNRTFRTQIRNALAHQDFDYVATRRQKFVLDAWSSPHDSDVTERYRPKRKSEMNFLLPKYQMTIIERCVIESYKHGHLRLPIKEMDRRAEMEEYLPCIHAPWKTGKWQKPRVSRVLSSDSVHQRDIILETLPFIRNLFDIENMNNNDSIDNDSSLTSPLTVMFS